MFGRQVQIVVAAADGAGGDQRSRTGGISRLAMVQTGGVNVLSVCSVVVELVELVGEGWSADDEEVAGRLRASDDESGIGRAQSSVGALDSELEMAECSSDQRM